MTDKPNHETGTVIRFNDDKGIGYIRCDSDGQQAFCHQSEIQMEGFRTLSAGQRVSFMRVPTEKRLDRVNDIHILEESVAA